MVQCPVCEGVNLVMSERSSIEIDDCRIAVVSGWIEASWTRSSSVRSELFDFD